MVIVFDLDDTLYEEMSFVRSGFSVVADYLSPLLHMPAQDIFHDLNDLVAVQRDSVFNRFLEEKGIHSLQLIKRCLSVYRGHQPSISLYPAAKACLERFQGHPLYIVTDGNKLVQRRKFLALGLDRLVRRCFFTYAHGLHRSKPSPYCFEKICQIERVDPSHVIYVADNPQKDFVGIKPLGFHTIRVLTGPYAQSQVELAYEAEVRIKSLDELDERLVRSLIT
ncbi:HAD family hydrolase [Candidatus Protochlamydia phocaeensis]|uniref:HAD family hydrolase n=1 Tax=Candidatus Protochlamydia phocaeensis TaxID=1414722 RepID=UPI000837D8E8|nr:HAD family hydrolase [Candidatus Protochlamydia phocaeensis]